jgi:hypothetical protein
VSFAVSIIGHVSPYPAALQLHTQYAALRRVRKVAQMNKARIEHADKQQQAKKGKGKGKQTEFDMSSVNVPDLNLLAHSISSKYRKEASIPLFACFDRSDGRHS